MVSEALQDIFRDPKRMEQWKKKRDEKISEDRRLGIFDEYVTLVDINLIKRGMSFRASKSVEFGKTDQSMLNHIRNGILFLLSFNDALKKLNIRSLDEVGLKECIALFVVHDLHKLDSGEWMSDEDDNFIHRGSMEDEFELAEDVVRRFVEEMHLREFVPELKDEDYFSVAVALHKSRFSRPGARTSRFMDLEPFLYLMDNMASCSSPEEAVSDRSLTALRDGFPQNAPESQLNLQYHRLDDVKGILTGLLNGSVAEVLEDQGLVMLMVYQDGCVYLGKGMKRECISDEFVQRVYNHLEKSIQEAAPAISADSGSLFKKVDLQGNINCYRLSDEYFFFSGPQGMLRAYLDKALITARAEKKNKFSDDMQTSIDRALRAGSIDLELSETDKKAVVEYARAVNAVRKSFVSEVVAESDQVLLRSCDIWGVPEKVQKSLINLSEDLARDLTSGGKWEYAYAIARCVMETKHEEVTIQDLPPSTATDILFKRIWSGLKDLEGWDDFISEKTKVYRDELIEYIHDILSINGTISRIDNSGLSDPFDEYKKGGSGGRLCNLCNRGTLLCQSDMKKPKSVSFLEYNFSNRVFMGKSKPDNIYTCVPCGVELVLRLNGFDLPENSSNNKLYFHLIPDYFFTPESWELAHTILMKFSNDTGVLTAALAEKVFKSRYVGGSEEIDVDVYDPWIKALSSEEGDTKGRSIFQYMGQSYGKVIGDACMIFYKPLKNTTEFHFFGVYFALILAAYTGMRVVVSQSPITAMRARDFKEFVALDSIESHVADFYGKFITLSRLEEMLKASSALIRLGYSSSGLKDSMFPKYLRVVRDEPLPGSYLLKMVYRAEGEYGEKNVHELLDEALFIDKMKQRG
jgi:CRISPR-associated protein Csc3